MEDHSGIIVEVYELANLNPGIVQINNEYPNLGVIINQQTEFDHRIVDPIKRVNTDIEGNFNLSNIPIGRYNLVAKKDSWGWRYVYDVMVDKNSNSINIAEHTFILYPELRISGAINESIIAEPYHHLIIEDDVLFLPGSHFELKSNSVCRINENKKIEVLGNVKLQADENNFFWVTSNFSNKEEIKYYNSLTLLGDSNVLNNNIKYGRWSYANICLLVNVDHVIVSNNIFKNGSAGLYGSNLTELYAKNNIAINFTSINEAGIYYHWVDSGEISRNIVQNSHSGIVVKNKSSPLVSNNYCLNNYYSFQFFISDSTISNNIINNSNVGIRVSGRSEPVVSHNNINANTGVLIGFNSYFVRCEPIINYNNIKSEKYFFEILPGNPQDIDGTNNYYYSTDLTYIKSKIFDKSLAPTQYQDSIANVLIEPIKMGLLTNAGIN